MQGVYPNDECKDMMKVHFLTTSLGKKIFLPMFGLDALVLLLITLRRTRAPCRNTGKITSNRRELHIYRSSREIFAASVLHVYSRTSRFQTPLGQPSVLIKGGVLKFCTHFYKARTTESVLIKEVSL